MPARDTEIITRNFGAIWPEHVSNLVRLLIAGRQAFDGDLDMFLVMAIIGERTFSARRADPAVSFEVWQAGLGSAIRPEDINASSIAQFSGIARETVRRKLLVLEEKGWIKRDERGNLVATKAASQDLGQLTVISIDYLARMMKLLTETKHSGAE